MELFDVYNEKRKKLGYTKERGTILFSNEYNQGAEIWIFNDKQLLITKRAKNKSHAGKWEVPGGASIVNETTIDTIIREAKEEINIDINKKNISLLNTSLYKKQFVDIYISRNIDLKNIKLQLEEVDDYKLVTKKEFLQMNNNKEIVKSVFQRYLLIEKKIDNYW